MSKSVAFGEDIHEEAAAKESAAATGNPFWSAESQYSFIIISQSHQLTV